MAVERITRQDSNWLVKEASIARSKLNKIQRAKFHTIEEKTLESIRISKLDYQEVINELRSKENETRRN